MDAISCGSVLFHLPHVRCDFWQFRHDLLAFLRRLGVSLSSDDPGISVVIEYTAVPKPEYVLLKVWNFLAPKN